MIVDNVDFVPGNFPKGIAGLAGLRGLGTCQWPQPGVPMVYPSCATDTAYQQNVAPSKPATYSGITSVYDVPGLWLPPADDCVDSGGFVVADSGCVDRNLEIQAENFRRAAAYNKTLIASAGSAPSAPSAPIFPVNTGQIAAEGPGAMVTVNAPSSGAQARQQVTAGESVGGSGAVQDVFNSISEFGSGFDLKGEADILGVKIPYWLLGVGVAGGLFVMSRGGR